MRKHAAWPMRIPARTTALILLIGLLAPAAPAAALSRSAKITTAGLGPIRIGMSERQVEKAAKVAIRQQQGGGGSSCTTARLGDKNFLLFSKGRLARIYVENRRYATRSGIRVGDSEQKVLGTYPGEIIRTPHEYTKGSYLKIVDGNRKVVFETDGAKVTGISTGRRPEIDYVEACS